MPNKFLSIKNILFSQILTQNASNQLKLAEKQAIRPNNNKKISVCQKLVKNTQNRLEMIFKTKDQIDCVLISLFIKFVSKRF